MSFGVHILCSMLWLTFMVCRDLFYKIFSLTNCLGFVGCDQQLLYYYLLPSWCWIFIMDFVGSLIRFYQTMNLWSMRWYQNMKNMKFVWKWISFCWMLVWDSSRTGGKKEQLFENCIVAMIEILHILLHKQLNWMPFHRLHAGVKSPCFLRMLIARRTLGHSWSPLNCWLPSFCTCKDYLPKNNP